MRSEWDARRCYSWMFVLAMNSRIVSLLFFFFHPKLLSREFPYEDSFIEIHRLNPDAGRKRLQKYLRHKTALDWIKILSEFLFSCRRLLVNRSRQQPLHR